MPGASCLPERARRELGHGAWSLHRQHGTDGDAGAAAQADDVDLARVAREPGATIPLVKIDARLEPRDVEDNALSQALRPSARDSGADDRRGARGGDAAARAVGGGALDIDEKSAYISFHDYLAAPNGALHLGLKKARAPRPASRSASFPCGWRRTGW